MVVVRELLVRRAMKKVYVLIGNYGSGKTELALNFAINAAAEGGTPISA